MTKRLERKVDMLLGMAKDLDQKVDYLIESRRDYVFGRRGEEEYSAEERGRES